MQALFVIVFVSYHRYFFTLMSFCSKWAAVIVAANASHAQFIQSVIVLKDTLVSLCPLTWGKKSTSSTLCCLLIFEQANVF